MNYSGCSSKRKGKQGSLEDLAFLVIMLAVIAIFVYPVMNSLTQINNEIQNMTQLSNESRSIAQDTTDRYPRIMEGIYAVLLILGFAGTFILAQRIDTHMPLFIIAMVFFTAMLLVVPLLANAWDSVTSGDFRQNTDHFPIIAFVMQHYLQIMLVSWFLIGFSIFAKRLT